jgi:hypothetical protein
VISRHPTLPVPDPFSRCTFSLLRESGHLRGASPRWHSFSPPPRFCSSQHLPANGSAARPTHCYNGPHTSLLSPTPVHFPIRTQTFTSNAYRVLPRICSGRIVTATPRFSRPPHALLITPASLPHAFPVYLYHPLPSPPSQPTSLPTRSPPRSPPRSLPRSPLTPPHHTSHFAHTHTHHTYNQMCGACPTTWRPSGSGGTGE